MHSRLSLEAVEAMMAEQRRKAAERRRIQDGPFRSARRSADPPRTPEGSRAEPGGAGS